MDRTLNEHEINYVFSHLELIMDTSILRNDFHYGEPSHETNKIVFIPHNKALTISHINDLPILFASKNTSIYSIDKNGNLIFYHDLLKSAFYLLSGYDEQYVNTMRDGWGRVKYDGSIQKKLMIPTRPVVNEYFDLILEGINSFLTFHNKKPLVKKRLFESFGFLLSHDIDVIDKYGWPHLGYSIKELIGLVSSKHSKRTILIDTLKSVFQFINPARINPYWNFDYLLAIEEKFGFKSSYYFLDKEAIGGSKYSFTEPRLIGLFKRLKDAQHEIGIHGTTKTIKQPDSLTFEITKLSNAADVSINGGRQHRLWLDLPSTFKIHRQAGLKYDSSFGFAEHEGFRNSFCLPFKPYDFETQKAIDIWQFPLMVMDVTLFSYRNLTPSQIEDSIISILNEVQKHNGIFTLLWHNSFFDEIRYPGVTKTYEKILTLVSSRHAKSFTGASLAKYLEIQMS